MTLANGWQSFSISVSSISNGLRARLRLPSQKLSQTQNCPERWHPGSDFF